MILSPAILLVLGAVPRRRTRTGRPGPTPILETLLVEFGKGASKVCLQVYPVGLDTRQFLVCSTGMGVGPGMLAAVNEVRRGADDADPRAQHVRRRISNRVGRSTKAVRGSFTSSSRRARDSSFSAFAGAFVFVSAHVRPDFASTSRRVGGSERVTERPRPGGFLQDPGVTVESCSQPRPGGSSEWQHRGRGHQAPA